MLGVIGIVVALVVLVALTFKGWHMGVVAIASSLIIILTSQYSRLSELTEEKEKVQAELDEKMERWMYLTELNEKIEAQK